MRYVRLTSIGLTLLALNTLLRAEENWPQFRGPNGQGNTDASLATKWGEGMNVTWKTPIHGKAWSSPVIWKNQIWMTTATEDGHELGVVCVDKTSGKILIDKTIFHIEKPQYCIPFNSYASPTPCIEEGRIYVTWGAPGTACLDTSDAKILWQRTDFVCNHFRSAGSSPLLWNDSLFMNFDGSDFQYMVSLDKKTGQNNWRADRSIDFQDIQPNGKPLADGDMRKAFSTPRIMMDNGRPILISLGSHAVYCYDPGTGNELWRTEYRQGFSASLTPVIGDGMVYCCTGNGAIELWAIKPDGHGVVTNTNVVWKQKKKIPTRPSPVLVGGELYLVNDVGILGFLDAKTGESIFSGRIDGEYSASPIATKDKVYFFNQTGITTVIETGREFKVVAENRLDDGIMGSPAVSGNALFIRTKTNLYRIEEK
jgi:outer membrane protein assembly factor BamB